ncbi:MAG: restriction endonuclease subunit S [Catenibacterium mitsuokai]|uniref:restriction endonuclease subunit S n=1 Tax=Lactobacillus amylovorus TaxID=1604 RepID=UPI00232F331E|nr:MULTISPECIES: restriction endonuclease subunit S [Bacillota]MDB6264101.1 restriction endonuclease subunit S [Lactobacillus amylovorus]MDD6595662.1 restriction endonuclease subunit S [Catenibacterium mitsuokai]
MVTWEQRKLGDKITRIKSYSISHGYETMHDTNTKYIHYGDIHTGKVKIINDINILPNIKDNNYIGLNKGDIVVADASEDYKGIADACLVNTDTDSNKIVAGLHTIALRPQKDTYPQYLYTYLSTDIFKHFGYKTGTGLKVFGISYKELAKFLVSSPSIKEQKEISKLISLIEKNIDLQQRKLNELKEVKKTLLSQLFPSKGQYRPIIRFKKFTNKWTKRKLGNIAKIIGGGTPSTSNHDYWNGNINWYSPTEIGNNIFVNSSNKKISIKGLNNSSAKLLPGGKTILFTSRAGIGNMAIMLTDGCTNQGFQSWVIDDTKIDIYFLYSLGRLLKHDAIRQASGSTFLEISNKEVKKLLLEIPSFTEQKLIGNMLRKIDDDIVRQKERIILITKIKKNLLQKLFV